MNGGGTLSRIDLPSLLFDSVQFIVQFRVKLRKLKLGFLRAFDILHMVKIDFAYQQKTKETIVITK